jgi:voltage-gated potassium channel
MAQYNPEHLDDLSVDELDLLKETTDSLIDHVERLKRGQEARVRPRMARP